MIKNKKIVRPARLQPGDTLGVVAPAGPCDRETLEQGLRVVEEMGFKPFVPPELIQTRGYLAGPDDHRAGFVNRLFADESIAGIICARGGYGTLRILPLLDFDVIENNPKVFIGFSDITALMSVFFNRCGLVSFHGPVVTSLADASGETRTSLFSAVTSTDKLEFRLCEAKTVKPGTATGKVCGGNLTVLSHLIGTPFAPCFENKILFLEDRAEAPYRIDRMLIHMKLAGCFDKTAGIILGDFEACGPTEAVLNIFADVFGDCPLPILAGLPAGHGKHNLTLPLGIDATLDADNHALLYHQAATVI